MKPIKGKISSMVDTVKGVNQLNLMVRRSEAILKGIEAIRAKFHKALKSKSPEDYIKRTKEYIQIPILHNYKYAMYNTILPLISSRLDTFTVTTDRDYICPMEAFYENLKDNDAMSNGTSYIYYNKGYKVKPSQLKANAKLYDTAYRIVGFPQDDRSASVAIAMQILRDFKRNNTIYSLEGAWFSKENLKDFNELWDYDKSIFVRPDDRWLGIPTIDIRTFQNEECSYSIGTYDNKTQIYEANFSTKLCGALKLIDDELCFVIDYRNVLRSAFEILNELDSESYYFKQLKKKAQEFAETLKISPEELHFNKPNREEAIEAIFNMIEKSLKLMFSIH